MEEKKYKQYTLKSLLEAHEKVEIPIIQRDYAQGRQEAGTTEIRNKFLDAIHGKLAADEPLSLDFVYGDVTGGTFSPLDGQQRLTTLVLLHWYAARREDVAETEWGFLRKFSYATRVSARKFFEMLMDFTPVWGQASLSAQIRDQRWFAVVWGNDPTIKSALVMLDAIDKKFADLASPADKRLWRSLTARGLVSFFFLSIDDMGMTDDLYVKMNSRGKPLTTFEHFKAMMESRVKEFDKEAANRIGRKFDTEWTRMLWRVRGESNIVDWAFVNYIRFIANIVRFRKGEAPIQEVFDALDVLFGNVADREANLSLFKSMFNIWCGIGDIQAFFDGLYTREENAEGKIRVFIEGGASNPFVECCRNAGITLGNQVWLYAVCTYLLNRERIADGDRYRRLRTVNNLINASALREENMRTVLNQVDKIVQDGVVEYAPNGFARTQIDEEQAKWEYIDKHPEDAALVYKLEDHPLLRGTIYIVGLDHLKLCDKFYALFSKDIDPLLRCRALLAQGDYSQLIDDNLSGWGWSKYQFATAKDSMSWRRLFHPSQDVRNEKLNERTGRVLREMLESLDLISDDTLQGVVDKYKGGAKEKARFDWRYYMVCYAGFLMGTGEGYYAWRCVNGEEDPYLFFRLEGVSFKHRHWVVLLHILQCKREGDTSLPTAKHGYSSARKHEIPLVLKKNGAPCYYIRLRSSGYDVYNSEWELIRHVEIEQKDGVDTQNRIEIGLKLVDELLQG